MAAVIGSVVAVPIAIPSASAALVRGIHQAAGAALTNPGHPSGPGSHCNFDPSNCLLPFPDDWWTEPDSSTLTGLRVDIPQSAMPSNDVSLPISSRPYNDLDGFSPGATLELHVPGLDTEQAFDANHIVTDTDIETYLDPDQEVLVFDAATGQRWPIWAEVDVTSNDPSRTLLMIHPAVNFSNDTRYIVVLRNLHTVSGQTIAPPASFVPYLDGTAPASDPRAAHIKELLYELAADGVSPSSLYLTWDFTVASQADISDSLLSMRNRAFSELGDNDLADGVVQGHSPSFTVESVQDRLPSQDADIAREVVLNVTVPCFIWPTCSLTPTPLTAPGGALAPLVNEVDQLDPGANLNEGIPDVGTGRFIEQDPSSPYSAALQNPVSYQARLICNIPRAAYVHPARISLYGHGLFGTPYEIDASDVEDMSERHDIVYCATDWLGMAEGDIPNALVALLDLSHFPSLIDRVQQGLLDQLICGRALIAPGGIWTNPAFQSAGHPIYDPSHLYYDGNSQGGIYGGTLLAISPDIRRGVLGVPGMDFSVLVYRSSDFVAAPGSFSYETPYELAYPDPETRLIGLDLVQMLWDRADPDGFIAHLTTDPLPDTPTHQVLIQMAFGDHQVTNIMTETEARTIGIPIVWPALLAGRSSEVVPYWGLAHLSTFPFDGSAIVVFDSGPVRSVNGQIQGTGPPPATDVPVTQGDDPHEDPRATVCGQQQKSDFLQPNGVVTDPCGGPPYFSAGYQG
jgi:hypothetical protein